MRIGIDCRLWDTTTGRYIRENVKRIAELDKKNEYVVFMPAGELINTFDFPKNFKKVIVDIHWHTFKEQFLFPIILLKENLDLVHVPYFNVPVLYPKKIVTTIHDLTILRVNTGLASTHSYIYYKIKKLGAWIAFWVAAIRSTKVLTVSEFVKDDIVKQFSVPAEKVIVTVNGVSSDYRRWDDHRIAKMLPKYKIAKPYIFYEGNAHPHKNIESLLDAFEIIHENFPLLNLVLGGKKDYFYERLEDKYKAKWKGKDILDRVSFIGYMDEPDLPGIFSGAEIYTTASFSEGFGLQLLESFGCGTRVVCSNTTSLPEVGGDIAYYFDPTDVKDIASKIIFALRDYPDERVKKGYERVKKFSWDDSARKTLETYEDCISA